MGSPSHQQQNGTGTRFCGLNISWLHPTCVLILITYIYCIYIGLFLLPGLQKLNASNSVAQNHVSTTGFISSSTTFQTFLHDPHASTFTLTEFVLITLIFHVLLIMFAASYIKAIVTPPGSVPVEKVEDEKKWHDGIFDMISESDDKRIESIIVDPTTDLTDPETQDFIKRQILAERKRDLKSNNLSNGLKRTCQMCSIYKPDRCHHCKICGHCVLRMDHHCPWVANCIGFRNYKYFLLILIYVDLLLTMILITMYSRFTRCFAPILSEKDFYYIDLQIAIAYGISCLLWIGLVLFFAYHLYLTLNSLTSIERNEKVSSESSEIRYRWAVAHIKFNRGYYGNWCHVMGESYMWFVPVDANPENDGTYSQPEFLYGGMDKKA